MMRKLVEKQATAFLFLKHQNISKHMNYQGSKARLARHYLPIILKGRNNINLTTYIEPFAGGLNMLANVPGKRIANDINPFLIAMWIYIQKYTTDKLPKHITQNEYYKQLRFYQQQRTLPLTQHQQIFNNEETLHAYALCGWVGYMASYNGRFYNGYSGNDKKRNYIAEHIANIHKQIPYIKDVTFTSQHYQNITLPDTPSIVYCDPPYKNTIKYTVYDKYFNHEEFYQWAIHTARQGHMVYISEYEMPQKHFVCLTNKILNTTIGQRHFNKSEKLFIPKIQQQ